MREFLKDWKRWSRVERVAALVILSIVLTGLPAALAMNAFH